MTKFNVGDLVVLKSGSMRMVVEDVSADDAGDETVQTVWCNEGVIGRDRFSSALLNKWEHREDSPRSGGPDRGGDRPPRGKPYGGDREGSGKPYRGGGERGGGEGDRPRKTGWDGKPREKKFYRKDD
jgi:uncharacterized protein YodC (DUF2158 family)